MIFRKESNEHIQSFDINLSEKVFNIFKNIKRNIQIIAYDFNGFDVCIFVNCFFVMSASVVHFLGMIQKNISYCFIRDSLVSLSRTSRSNAKGSFEINWFPFFSFFRLFTYSPHAQVSTAI